MEADQIAATLLATQKLARDVRDYLNRAASLRQRTARQITLLLFWAYNGDRVVFRDLDPNLAEDDERAYYSFTPAEIAAMMPRG